MSKWNGKKFSVYTSDEKSALGLIKELGEQTNYNTDELEQVKISDNKKVSHQEMQETYKLDKDANFTGSWHGIKKPTASQEGLQATVDKIVEEDIPSINEQLEHNVRELDNKISFVNNDKASKSELGVERERINSLVKNTGSSVDDVELQDIRIDGDGVTHESAGDSVRSQFNSLKEKVVKHYSSYSLWELGGIVGATGVNEKREDRFRTVSYIAHNIDSIKDTTNGGLVTFAWDKDGNYIGTWDGSTFGTSSTWVFTANIKGYRELFPTYEFKVITKAVIDLDNLIITQHSSGDIDEDFKRKGATVDSYKTGKRFKTIEDNLSDIKESVNNDLYKGVDITSSLNWRSGSSATNTGNLVLNEDSTKITLPKVMNLGVSTITPKDGYQIYKLISDHEINNGDVLSNWTAYGYTSDSYTTKKDEYILIKITATDGSKLNVSNIKILLNILI